MRPTRHRNDWIGFHGRTSTWPGYLGSLLIHGCLLAALLYVAGAERRRLAAQELAFAEQIEQQERQLAETERLEREKAAGDLRRQLARQLSYEMDFLVTPDLDEQLHQQLMDEVDRDIDELLGDYNGLASMTDEQLNELAGQLRLEAFEQLRLNLDDLRRQLLISRIRSYIRSEVAPAIQTDLDNRLKNEVGRTVEERVSSQAAEDRRERLYAVGREMADLSRTMTAAARSTQAVARDVQRRNYDRAAQGIARRDETWTPLTSEAEALLAQARQHAPSLSDAVDEVAAARPDRRAAERLSTAASLLAADTADKPAQPPGKTLDAVNRAAAAQNESAAAYKRLADTLTSAGRSRQFDAMERAQVAAAEQATRDQLEQKVRRQVLETAVPQAAGKIMTTLDEELRKRRLHTQTFRDFLETDIRKALDEQAAENLPDARNATERLSRHYDLADSEPLRQAAAEAADAAAKLARLNERQARDRQALETVGADPAARQNALAGEIAGAYARAATALGPARTATVNNERAVSDAQRQLGRRIGPGRASNAASALRREVLDDARNLMTQAEQDLSKSASMLADVAAKLSKEADIIDARRKAAAEVDASATAESDEKVNRIAERLTDAVDKTLESAARRSAASLDLRGMFAGDENLDSADMLADRLQQMQDNLADGRGLEGLADFAMLGPGMGAGARPGGGDGIDWGLRVRRYNSNYNRAAYEEFVKFLRHRLNPANYYDDPPEIEGLDSVASEPSVAPADRVVVLPAHDEATATPDDEPAEEATRRVPEPQFPHSAFGAAAMMDRPIVIDGDLSDWGEQTHPFRLIYSSQLEARDPDGPQLQLRWSAEGFYIAYTVRDDNGIQPCELHSWSGDCLEFMIDMANSRLPEMTGNVNAHKFSFTPFGCRGRTDLTVWEMGRGMNGMLMAHDYPDTAGIKGVSAAKIIPGYGYSVEAFLSRRALTLPALIAGRYVGVNFSLNRGGESGSSRLWACSSALATWRKPDTWGDVLLLGSDATLRFPDLTQDDPIDRTSILPGEVLDIEVADADMNLNVEKIDRVSAMVSADGGSGLYAVLAETGENTGVFRASLNTAQYFQPPAEHTLNIRSGGRVTLRYIDARAGYGEKNLPVTIELPVGWPVLRIAGKP